MKGAREWLYVAEVHIVTLSQDIQQVRKDVFI